MKVIIEFEMDTDETVPGFDLSHILETIGLDFIGLNETLQNGGNVLFHVRNDYTNTDIGTVRVYPSKKG
jgi:hypothetical protein